MTKIRLVIMTVVLALLLSSCSSVESFLRQQIEEQSGIKDDTDYQTYQTYFENGRADENGNYIPEDEETTEAESPSVSRPGSVRVTFGNNSKLSILYFYDQEMTDAIEGTECYLNPGESIYAQVRLSEEALSMNLCFDKFQVFENLDNNLVLLAESKGEDNCVFTVPDPTEGTELSVLPLWKPAERSLSFELVLIDENGETTKSDIGIWKVGKEPVKNETVTISAARSFGVEFDYSSVRELSNTYYLDRDSSYPEISRSGEGIIKFAEQDTSSSVDSFRVVLRKYTTLTINNKKTLFGNRGLISLTVNGEEKEVDKDRQNYTLENGDELILEIKGDYKIDPAQSQDGIKITELESVKDNLRYKIVVDSFKEYFPIVTVSPKTANQGEHQNKMVQNGKVTVTKSDGTVIINGDVVDDKEKVTVRITANKGYYVSGGGVKEDVYTAKMSYKDYCKNIDRIIEKHPILKYIEITIVSSDPYGTCTFSIGKDGLSDGTYTFKQGQTINLKYELLDSSMSIRKDKNVNINRFKQIATVGINVELSLDGKTITRDMYIHIENKTKQ